MPPKQFQVFDFIVNKQWPTAWIAETLHLSATYIHLVKFRLLHSLKKEITRLEKECV